MAERLGKVVAQGKTKVARRIYGQPGRLHLTFTDAITAGDGIKREVLPGKGWICAEMTANVMECWESVGLPTHYIARADEPNALIVDEVQMIPVEVVVRRAKVGSYRQRHPDDDFSTDFKQPFVEFFLKDDSRHDPIIVWNAGCHCYELHDAHQKLGAAVYEVFIDPCGLITRRRLERMGRIASDAFCLMENEFGKVGIDLQDDKVEFGLVLKGRVKGRLVIADEMTPDSLRALNRGAQFSKQVYRDEQGEMTPESMARLTAIYGFLAGVTRSFGLTA